MIIFHEFIQFIYGLYQDSLKRKENSSQILSLRFKVHLF